MEQEQVDDPPFFLGFTELNMDDDNQNYSKPVFDQSQNYSFFKSAMKYED